MSKKNIINVYPFAYHKIVQGDRKIDIRPYKKAMQEIGMGDVICYSNIETKEEVLCEVKGIALFDNFETAINMLDEKLIGYETKDEIKLRVSRMYDKKEVEELGVVAFFIDEVKHSLNLKLREIQRVA
jgi:ASC-1-like (ASCH) protein